MIDLNKWVVA